MLCAAHFSRNSPQWAISDLFISTPAFDNFHFLNGSPLPTLLVKFSYHNHSNVTFSGTRIVHASKKFFQSFKFVIADKFMQPLGESLKCLHHQHLSGVRFAEK